MNDLISVIHPSRGRPQEPCRIHHQLMAQAGQPFEYLLAVDSDDPRLPQYHAEFDACAPHGGRMLVQNSNSVVQAINMAASQAKGDILLVMSDDFELAPGWDATIRAATAGRTCWLLKTFDGLQEWIITLPIMDRALYQRLGYVYHPAYRHMYADTHLSSICDLLGVTQYRLDIHFPHRHYCTGAREPDEVNVRANATYAEGEATLLEHHLSSYGLAPDEIVGTIQSERQRNWLQIRRSIH